MDNQKADLYLYTRDFSRELKDINASGISHGGYLYHTHMRSNGRRYISVVCRAALPSPSFSFSFSGKRIGYAPTGACGTVTEMRFFGSEKGTK